MSERIRSPKPQAPSLRYVLLVAHEDSTRLTAKWTLTNFGYQVDVARCAEDALALFDPMLHDAVVTADTMPGITESELAHIIKLRSPRTPVVLMAKRAPPEDRSCLDAVLEEDACAWGLTGVLQNLLAALPK
jgi:CheY-like chemotaxis protein